MRLSAGKNADDKIVKFFYRPSSFSPLAVNKFIAYFVHSTDLKRLNMH
jgi:hypothetical protein